MWLNRRGDGKLFNLVRQEQFFCYRRLRSLCLRTKRFQPRINWAQRPMIDREVSTWPFHSTCHSEKDAEFNKCLALTDTGMHWNDDSVSTEPIKRVYSRATSWMFRLCSSAILFVCMFVCLFVCFSFYFKSSLKSNFVAVGGRYKDTVRMRIKNIK